MSENSNLADYRKRVRYFNYRAQLGNSRISNTWPQASGRGSYPGSFTPAGLYIYGAETQQVEPNHDRFDGAPLNFDRPTYFYTTPEQFNQEYYRNNTTLYDRNGRVPWTAPIVSNHGLKTVTGHRRPSIASKQIWLEEEKYLNDY